MRSALRLVKIGERIRIWGSVICYLCVVLSICLIVLIGRDSFHNLAIESIDANHILDLVMAGTALFVSVTGVVCYRTTVRLVNTLMGRSTKRHMNIPKDSPGMVREVEDAVRVGKVLAHAALGLLTAILGFFVLTISCIIAILRGLRPIREWAYDNFPDFRFGQRQSFFFLIAWIIIITSTLLVVLLNYK